MDIASTIQEAVRRRGLSVNQVAKETGLNQSGLNRFFNGSKAELQLSTIQILFDYLGLEVRQRSRKRDGKR